MENKTTDIALIQSEINKQISNPQVLASLMEITFKGLQPQVAKRAMLEAMMRGFTFQDFLVKNVYAIPFGQGYSLVSSIDYARKLGVFGNVVGIGEPIFEEDGDGNLISCKITVKKKTAEYIGDYSAKVYLSEYTTKRNLWITKPRTMLSKVAEAHALRKACPDKLSQVYIEEENEREIVRVDELEEKKEIKKIDFTEKLKSATTLLELRDAWSSIPGEFKTSELTELKDILRDALEEKAKSNK